MRFALDFRDSEVRDVVADAGGVRVRFSAAAVRGEHGERGWLPGVTLALTEATLAGDASLAFGKVSEGLLRHDGRDARTLALPGTLAGEVQLTLRFANDTALTLRGRTLAAGIDGGPRFAEDLSC